jgi:1,4-dihydroxy-6-naphthoate synthase
VHTQRVVRTTGREQRGSRVTAYTLAYSPCPNDTYIFAALTNGLLGDAPAVRAHLADIEELNNAAARGQFELTKVSYGAIPFLMDRYRILPSGGAVGRGYGPLLVALPGESPPLFSEFAHKRIAVPGERTTAFLLLQLALRARPKIVKMRFDQIVPAVVRGEVDAGLIIHESRFTYREAGLISIADLGEWWENMTLLPTPLGAILVRNDVDDDQVRTLNTAIRRSLAFARENETAVMPYVREHAVETSDEVTRAHIQLYVNEFTNDLGEIGREAVHALFSRAHVAGILHRETEPRFAAVS